MEFEEKEFLVFHSVLCLLQHVDARRQMQVVHRLVDGEQPSLEQNALRQRVVNIFHGIALKQVFLQLLKEARRETVVAEFFREVVNAHHALWRLALLISIHFGVNDAVGAIKQRGFSKHDILHAGLIGLLNGFHPVEPHTFHRAGAVAKQADKPTARALALRVESDESPLQLHAGNVGTPQVADVMNGAAVDISERKIVEHVVETLDVEFLRKNFGSFWPNSRKVFNIVVGEIIHDY